VIEIPTSITCKFDSGKWGHSYCRKPAVSVVLNSNYGREPRYEGRCKRHASIDARRSYGALQVIEFTQEIVDQMLAELNAEAKAKAEEARVKAVQNEAKEAAYRVRRHAEAQVAFVVERKDEQGPVDWDATHVAGDIVYGPSLPMWYVHPESTDVHWNTSSVKVVAQDGYPTTIELRASSRLDINEASALIEALVEAVNAARQA